MSIEVVEIRFQNVPDVSKTHLDRGERVVLMFASFWDPDPIWGSL